MAPVIKTVLQKTGFAATFPPDIFFGPVKYRGFGCRHPFYHQESIHIMTFVNEIYNKTQMCPWRNWFRNWALPTPCTVFRMAHMNLVLLTHGLGLCGNLWISMTSVWMDLWPPSNYEEVRRISGV
jgi:hypothetical protein